MNGTATPASGPVRLARAGVLAVAAAGLATAAHLGGGGHLPGPLALAFLTAVTLAAVLVASLRRLHAPAMVAALGGLQLVLHAGLTLLAPDPTATATLVAHGHHHAVIHVTGPAHAMSAMPGGCGPLMLAAHALATVVTAVLLARGEDLLWLAAAVVAPLAALAVAAARTLRPAVRPAPMPVSAPVLRRQFWALAVPLRGPPTVA